jgi:uncharacterized protein (TIGR00299 family) protein
MIVGALLDAGLALDRLNSGLAKLRLQGYTLRAEKTVKSGLSATKFNVDLEHPTVGGHHPDREPGDARRHGHRHRPDPEHGHDYPPERTEGQDHAPGPGHVHESGQRNLADITAIIDASSLPDAVKEKSKRIFTRLAEAEARVHSCSVDEIHFHEVGAVDAIVDIVGAVIGLEVLGVAEIRASKLHLGSGFVDCAHGRLPVPPPAVTELVKGIPCYASDVEGELVTPTGAAILSTLASSFGPLPEMRIERTGYGAGRQELPIPNVLRVMIGETGVGTGQDRIRLIETNIDDMNPQFYEHIMERLLAEGARDVFLTPIVMKKSRPGLILSVLATEESTDALVAILLRETTTLGVRISDLKKRMILKREIVPVKTRWGDVRVKLRILSESETTVAPEYEDCKRIARGQGLPLRMVYETVKREAEDTLAGTAQPARPRKYGSRSAKAVSRDRKYPARKRVPASRPPKRGIRPH